MLAPAVYADLAGFPPILLQAGTNELLLDDSVQLAERAREADVDVILDISAEAATVEVPLPRVSTNCRHLAEDHLAAPRSGIRSGNDRMAETTQRLRRLTDVSFRMTLPT